MRPVRNGCAESAMAGMKMSAERYIRECAVAGYEYLPEVLSKARVGIIGLGGLGGLVTYLIAGAGVLDLHVADPDTVSLSNLHRQVLYDMEDIGTLKSAALLKRLKALDPEVKVRIFERIDETAFKDFARGCNLVLDLTDSQETRLKISALALKARVPLVEAAVCGLAGQIAFFDYAAPDFVREHGCLACLTGTGLSPTPPGISGPAAATLASLCAQIVLDILNGSYTGRGRVHVLDLRALTLRSFTLRPEEHCSCRRNNAD